MRKLKSSALLVGLALWTGLAAQGRPRHKATVSEPPVVHDGDSPAYHAEPPRTKLGPILSAGQFSDPRIKAVYAMAAKVPKVLYQEPCYCYCDKGFGHHSLHDCFAGTHGSECGICLEEGAYTYQQTKLGKTPGQIRAGIERGEYRSIDLNALGKDQKY
ncbi:MAG: CYCXC family (seleno)protein [Terriglobales bacterium]